MRKKNRNKHIASNDKKLKLSSHAKTQMKRRGISSEAVRMVLKFGREVFTRGAIVYAVGRKEIEHFKNIGINLVGLNGLQVVCGEDLSVITVYRNRDFKRLRPTFRGTSKSKKRF